MTGIHALRNDILNQRGPMAENGMTGEQVNDVLGLIDEYTDPDPAWAEGEPANLAAAVADALEWMKWADATLHARFGLAVNADERERVRRAMDNLQLFTIGQP